MTYDIFISLKTEVPKQTENNIKDWNESKMSQNKLNAFLFIKNNHYSKAN